MQYLIIIKFLLLAGFCILVDIMMLIYAITFYRWYQFHQFKILSNKLPTHQQKVKQSTP